jgi:hypothetical protein
MSAKKSAGKTAIELCEEAVFTLRHAPGAAWASYYFGTMPFMLGLLYFWSNMTRGRHSEEQLIYGSLALALLFLWMKTWQVVFALRLRAHIAGYEWNGLTVRYICRICAAQARWQSSGFVVLPIALIITAPFGWAYAYYQNLVALCAPDPDSLSKLHSKSVEQARLWAKQNHVILGVITALSFFILLNLGILLMALPQILITFFGVKEVFRPNTWLLLNTTFLMVLVVLMHLILDPFLKALYVLRCFYGESRATGEDLRVQLRRSVLQRRLPQAIATLLLVSTAISFGAATETMPLSPTAERLEEKISEVLKKSEYDWRFPREVVKSERKSWLLSFFQSVSEAIVRFLKWIGRGILSVFEWIARLFRGKAPAPSFSGWSLGNPRGLITLLAILVILVGAYFLWRNRVRTRRATILLATASPSLPDIRDENVGADQLPEDEWLKMANDLLNQGDLRLAIRALFLASLAHLATRQFVSLEKFKSNRDYERELKRRTAGTPQVGGAFSSMVNIYDRIWYGLYEPSSEMFSECRQTLQLFKTC